MSKQENPPPYTSNTFDEQTTVIVMQEQQLIPPAVVGSVQYGPNSQSITCPHCHSNIITQIKAETSRKTHIVALLLCVFCLWPCAVIPYCMDSCKNKNHHCPACRAYLGTYTN